MFNPVTIFKTNFQSGGVKSTIITLISGTLGAGCLSMPNAFRYILKIYISNLWKQNYFTKKRQYILKNKQHILA